MNATRQTAKIRTPRLRLKKPRTPKQMLKMLATTLNKASISPKRIPFNRAAADSSDAQLQQAVHDREELRARLLQQFNLILETRHRSWIGC